MISSIVRGNDFSMEINVVTPQYEETGTVWLDFNITECTNVAVNLICTKDQVVIPLKWHIKEDTTNVIIADVEGKYLHSGAVYALEITGLDAEEKAWRFKNKAVFSIVDDTAHARMQESLMADPLEVNAEIGLTVHVIPVLGPQGPQGESGPQGEKGDTGPQGADGSVSFDDLTPEQKEELRGPQGFTGEQGVQGEKGDTGAQGPQGATGAQGEKGDIGEQGPQGEKGEDGFVSFDDLTPEQKEELRGPQGAQGPQGEKGQDGVQGPQGDTGAQGPQGEKGQDGQTGPQGEKGQDGAQGPQGEQGEQGPQGADGQDGQTGPQGDTGAQGPQGEKGQDGAQGPQGEQGPQGPKGDGADIEPVTLVVDEQMPQNPDPNAVYMIQTPIKLKTINNQDIIGEGNIEIQGGTQGPQGSVGQQGPQGSTGQQGPQGSAGQVPSIIPSVSLNTSITNNVLTVSIVLYDSLENKLYNLQDYATHINKTISITTTSGNIYVKFDNEDAFYINIGGFTIDTSNVSIDPNTGIITAPVLTQSVDMTVEAQYCPEFWLDTIYIANFDAFGPVKYVLSSVPSNMVTGYQGGTAQSGIKIDIVSSMPASPDANTLYVVV